MVIEAHLYLSERNLFIRFFFFSILIQENALQSYFEGK